MCSTVCCSYLAQYGSYRALLALDLDAYVGKMAAQGSELNLADISKEVTRQMNELAYMEENLIPAVNLGLLHVNCVKVSLLSHKGPIIQQACHEEARDVPSNVLASFPVEQTRACACVCVCVCGGVSCGASCD